MRFHRNLVSATVQALGQIYNHDQQADKVLQATLKKDKRWGSRDRGFIAETTYDMVRWRRLYAEIAGVASPFSTSDIYRMLAVWAILKGHRLPDWEEFSQTPARKIKGRFDQLSKIRKFRESVPDWLDDLGQQELGPLWEAELGALNQAAPVILRVNTLKTDRKALITQLGSEGVKATAVDGLPHALKLEERENVFRTKAFKKGMFEVQDASSQKVAPFLEPQPGMRIVDACAGAGGKTLHLSALMENKGQIIALDIYPQKLNELKRRARRAGAHNIETRLVDTTKKIKKLKDRMHKVLIDAPCSGLGVLRRNPDTKWKLTPAFMKELREKQQEIFQTYEKLVMPGGHLVYATCSILPSENRQQVESFLESEAGKAYVLEDDQQLLVHQTGHDGFYMARLRKKN